MVINVNILYPHITATNNTNTVKYINAPTEKSNTPKEQPLSSINIYQHQTTHSNNHQHLLPQKNKHQHTLTNNNASTYPSSNNNTLQYFCPAKPIYIYQNPTTHHINIH